MKIAILSDIHDHITNLEKALSKIQSERCESIICLGDICAPFTAKKLANVSIPTYISFGNNDADTGKIVLDSPDSWQIFPASSEHGEVILEGKKIAFTHYPKHGRMLSVSGKFDAVFYGHDHKKNIETVNNTLLVNPGAICGILLGQLIEPTFAIYDTPKNSVIHISLP